MADSSSHEPSDEPVRVWVDGKSLQFPAASIDDFLASSDALEALQKKAAATALSAAGPAIQNMLDATQPAIRTYLDSPAWWSAAERMVEALQPIHENLKDGSLAETLKGSLGILDSLDSSTLQAVEDATRLTGFDRLRTAIDYLGPRPLTGIDEADSGTVRSSASDFSSGAGGDRSPEEELVSVEQDPDDLRGIAANFRAQLGPRSFSKLYQQFKHLPIFRHVSDDLRSLFRGGKHRAQQLSGRDRVALALLVAVIIYFTALAGSLVAAKNSVVVDGLMEDAGWTPHIIGSGAAGGFIALTQMPKLVRRAHPLDKSVTRVEWR